MVDKDPDPAGRRVDLYVDIVFSLRRSNRLAIDRLERMLNL